MTKVKYLYKDNIQDLQTKLLGYDHQFHQQNYAHLHKLVAFIKLFIMDFLCRLPKQWHQSARIKAAFRNQILNIGNFCIITALSTTTTRASERSSLSSKFFYCNSSDELAFEANHDKASK